MTVVAEYGVGDWRTPRLVVSPFDEATEATLEILRPGGSGPVRVATPEDDTPDVGSQTWTTPAYEIDVGGEWIERWTVAAGAGAGTEEFIYEAIVGGAATDADLPPLVSLYQVIKRVGYTPDGDELVRLRGILSDASALIREKAETTWVDDDGNLETVPQRIRSICAWVAKRAFDNPEGLLQRSIGDSAKMYVSSDRVGGEAVYLTNDELADVRDAVGLGSFASITLVSPWSGTDTDSLLGS